MPLSMSATPLVFALIAINAIVSFYALYLDRKFFEQSLFNVGAVVKQKQFYRIITSGFLHGSPMHLVFNMLTLFFLGPVVEFTIGTLNFFIVYFGSQLTAVGASYLANRKDMSYSAIGASGSVSGVVLSYCTFAPFSMLYLFGIVPIPAVLFAIGYVSYSMALMRSEGRIAHEAHVGGAVGGVLITLLINPEIIGIG